MRTSLRKMGRYTGVIIPEAMLKEIGMTAGDEVDLSVVNGRIVLANPKKHPREGWAEEAAAIAAAGEGLAWPEFGNDGDDKLVW
jgi:antitoxin MazE